MNQFKLVLVRFPFTLLFVVGIAVLVFFKVNNAKVDIHESVWAFAILGFFLNIAVTLYLEEFKKNIYRFLLNIIPTILLAVYCFTLPDKLLAYQYPQLVTLGIVFILSAFVVSFLKKNNDIPFWNFSRDSIIQLIISVFFSLVFFAGISLALLSVDKLFNVSVDSKLYDNLAVVCFILFAPFYFLSNLPDEFEKRKQDMSFNKIFKIFGLYILLPILAVYTLILYVYLVQIIVKWELPNGWVSMLVSVLGLGSFLCMLILHPISKENKVVAFFFNYFALFLFPLIILMSVGIFRRIGDYGLTINRCYVLILNAWLFGISLYLFISKASHVKWIVISFSLVAFVASVGPWSVFSVTRNSVTKQLGKILAESHLLKDGRVSLKNEKSIQMDSISQIKTVEAIRYLVNNYGTYPLQNYFPESIKDKSVSEVLTILNLDEAPNAEQYFYAYLQKDILLVNIEPYHSFLQIKWFESQKHTFDDKQVSVEVENGNLMVKNKVSGVQTLSISLEKLAVMISKEIQKKPNKEFSGEELTIRGPNYRLVITSIEGKRFGFKNKIVITNLNALLFY